MMAPAGRVALLLLAMAASVAAVAAQQPAQPVAEPATKTTAAEKDVDGSTQTHQRHYDEDRYYYNPGWREHSGEGYYHAACRGAGQHCGHDYDDQCCHGLICSHGAPRVPEDAAAARGYRSSRGPPLCWHPCPVAPPGASPPGPNASAWACTGMWMGSTCTATCAGSGTAYTAVCAASGEWLITPGTCAAAAVDCGATLPSLTGYFLATPFTCPGGTTEGATCISECDQTTGDAYAGNYTTTCQANGTWSTPTGDCTCTDCACFSGDSQVVVRRSPQEPIAMRDLRIGDEVLCVSAPDLLTPGATRFCPVRSFARSEERDFDDMTRLHYTVLGSGATGSTTLSNLHMLHVLTGDAAALAATPAAATVDQLGAFDLVAAVHARPGQHIPVVAPGSAGGFVAAVIDAAEPVVAAGKYLPALEEPYIVVDGLVAPLWSAWPALARFADAPQQPARLGAHRLANALKHMFYAPLWMATTHAEGTPGHSVDWDGSDRAPLSLALEAAFVSPASSPSGLVAAPPSSSANFTAAAEWFAPRVAAWRLARAAGAEAEAAITAADVLAAWPVVFGEEPAPAGSVAAAAFVPAASAASCETARRS